MVDVEQMMQQWDPLVFHIVKKQCHWFVGGGNRIDFIKASDFDDVVQVGRMALLRAIKTFRTDGGAAFNTYAYRVISNALSQFVQWTDSEREFAKKFRRKALTPENSHWMAASRTSDGGKRESKDEARVFMEYIKPHVKADDLEALLEYHSGTKLKVLARARKISVQAMSTRLIRAREKAAVAIARERRRSLKVA